MACGNKNSVPSNLCVLNTIILRAILSLYLKML